MKKKKKNINNKRRNTFVGFAPKIEDNIKIKMRRKENKHKKKIYDYD
jgi:hypothetical protein